MAKFQGVDFYNVDGLLSEEERAVRDTVRAWVDDNLMPVIAEHYLEGRFPKHLVPQMAELGLFGANLPEEYGCAGLNHVAYGLIMQELEPDDVESIRGFIVPTDTQGFSAKDQKGKLSLRASDTSELVLQDVCVAKDAVLPKSAGLKSPLMCLTQARYGIAWGAVGSAMACYDEAVSYAKARVMFGKPIGGFQLQQARLAEMLTEITKAQLLSLQLGRLKDGGKVTPQQVSLAKRNNVSIATDVARETRRLLGANGILAEYQAMRHLANLESVYTYEGTHDIHTLILGQEITGLNAFN